MRGSLLKRASILAADALALVTSGANELALPREKAVNTTAAKVLYIVTHISHILYIVTVVMPI